MIKVWFRHCSFSLPSEDAPDIDFVFRASRRRRGRCRQLWEKASDSRKCLFLLTGAGVISHFFDVGFVIAIEEMPDDAHGFMFIYF